MKNPLFYLKNVCPLIRSLVIINYKQYPISNEAKLEFSTP